MKLSIVTGALDRPQSFARLLASVANHTRSEWEMIVADASEIPLECHDPRVQLIREKPRLGCAKGFNAAFRAARGEWVIWLNDDAEVLPDYDINAIRFMESHPKIGLGALHYREGARGFHVNAYFKMIYANFGIIRRELGDKIGWFDEQFPMYGSDNALAFRVLIAGKGIAEIPNARLIHYSIDDHHREKNNHFRDRVKDCERLASKYGPYLVKMNIVYADAGGIFYENDQTPDWAWTFARA